jgi:hypothetical protein
MKQIAYPGIAAQRERVEAIGGLRFDWVATAFGTWLIVGLYLDGWAHVHNPALETFFTPWHAILYSGYIMLAILLVGTAIINGTRGVPWRQVMPAGYGWSLVGAGIFALGGLGDMTWHIAFGIERSIDALLSPTHLLLAFGGGLMAAGPIRAAWARSDTRRAALWPTMLGLTFLLALFCFFTDYAHPFAHTWAAEVTARFSRLGILEGALGVASTLLQSGMLMGLIIVALRRWGGALPPGSLLLLITLPIGGMTFMQDIDLVTGPGPLVLVALVTGLITEALYRLWKPSAVRPAALRIFAFVVPALLYSLYFLAIQIAGPGIAWSINMWGGAIVLAGLTGWLVSYALVPGAAPVTEQV